MADGDFKDLTKRTAADKVLRDKEFNTAKDPKYYGYQRGLASMIKRTKAVGCHTLINLCHQMRN